MSLKDRLRRAALVILDAEDKPQPAAPPAAKPATTPAVSLAESRCVRCVHFSLEAGQEALRAQPAMMQAAATIPPWAMGRQVKRDGSGALIPPEGTSKDWLRAKWSDMGACELHQEGVWPFHVCKEFEALP